MTVSVSLREIREALAAQIEAYVSRDVNGYPYGTGGLIGTRCVVIAPAGDYVSYFGTFGEDGLADLRLEVKVIPTNATTIDAQIALDDYLSIGQGNASSVVDAVHSDRTLGGLVEDCVCLTASGPGDPEGLAEISGTLYVRIIFRKEGAQV